MPTVKTERLYGWYEWHCMYPGKYDDPFGWLAGIVAGCAFGNDGIYLASAARSIPLRPEDVEQAFRQGD